MCQKAQLRILLGYGDSIEKATTYFAWRPILHSLFATTHTHSIEEQIITELHGNQELIELLPLLNTFFNLTFPNNNFIEQMDSPARAQNTARLLTHLLQHSGTSQATAIVLEDVHWLDSASWNLLQRVYEDIPNLLLVIATRPLYEPIPLAYHQLVQAPHTCHLFLQPLPTDQSMQIVCYRLGLTSLPPEVVQFINEKAQGHPSLVRNLPTPYVMPVL